MQSPCMRARGAAGAASAAPWQARSAGACHPRPAKPCPHPPLPPPSIPAATSCQPWLSTPPLPSFAATGEHFLTRALLLAPAGAALYGSCAQAWLVQRLAALELAPAANPQPAVLPSHRVQLKSLSGSVIVAGAEQRLQRLSLAELWLRVRRAARCRAAYLGGSWVRCSRGGGGRLGAAPGACRFLSCARPGNSQNSFSHQSALL